MSTTSANSSVSTPRINTKAPSSSAAILAGVALVFFIFLGSWAISVVFCSGKDSTCPSIFPREMSEVAISFLNGFAGLVSAIVIAEFALTEPNETPGNGIINSAVRGRDLGKLLTFIYIGVWILFGAAAFILGTLIYPSRLPALDNLGQAFIGVVISGGYAWKGISNKEPPSTPTR